MTNNRTNQSEGKTNNKTIKQVLAMSNSAAGRWAQRNAPALPPMNLRQTLGYCRFSAAGQNPATIDKQQEFISDHCINKGWRKPIFFCDHARTGANDERPAWQDLIKRVRPGTIVVVHEMTRFARQAYIFLKMMRQVQAAGGTVELVNANTNDTMYLTIMAAVAEYDYRSVTTRLRDGRMLAVAKGVPYRKPSFGFAKEGKGFVINEVEAHWIREMFKMRMERASIGDIVRYLTENKVPTRTGGKWSAQRVGQILYNPLVAGYLVTKRPIFSWEAKA